MYVAVATDTLCCTTLEAPSMTQHARLYSVTDLNNNNYNYNSKLVLAYKGK